MLHRLTVLLTTFLPLREQARVVLTQVFVVTTEEQRLPMFPLRVNGIIPLPRGSPCSWLRRKRVGF